MGAEFFILLLLLSLHNKIEKVWCGWHTLLWTKRICRRITTKCFIRFLCVHIISSVGAVRILYCVVTSATNKRRTASTLTFTNVFSLPFTAVVVLPSINTTHHPTDLTTRVSLFWASHFINGPHPQQHTTHHTMNWEQCRAINWFIKNLFLICNFTANGAFNGLSPCSDSWTSDTISATLYGVGDEFKFKNASHAIKTIQES